VLVLTVGAVASAAKGRLWSVSRGRLRPAPDAVDVGRSGARRALPDLQPQDFAAPWRERECALAFLMVLCVSRERPEHLAPSPEEVTSGVVRSRPERHTQAQLGQWEAALKLAMIEFIEIFPLKTDPALKMWCHVQ
jgi:hypothetical protein